MHVSERARHGGPPSLSGEGQGSRGREEGWGGGVGRRGEE